MMLVTDEISLTNAICLVPSYEQGLSREAKFNSDFLIKKTLLINTFFTIFVEPLTNQKYLFLVFVEIFYLNFFQKPRTFEFFKYLVGKSQNNLSVYFGWPSLTQTVLGKRRESMKVQLRIPTVKLKISGKLFLKTNPELMLHSSYRKYVFQIFHGCVLAKSQQL